VIMSTRYALMTPEQKQKANARNRAYWLRNREKLAEKKRRHYFKYKKKYLTIERDRQYRKRYGITLDDYNRMLETQAGKCAICSTTTAGKKGQAFAVDHCHVTNQVRGLLCIKCNARLGWYEAHSANVAKYLAAKALT
jgi:Recombination endonuclease VII